MFARMECNRGLAEARMFVWSLIRPTAIDLDVPRSMFSRGTSVPWMKSLVVVIREDEPSVVLSLDKRFASGRVLELLHTSKFTVVGKVTEVWPTDEDGVNLYRRSVMSLLPGLTQMSSWGLMALLAGLGSGIDVNELRASAFAAAGIEDTDGPTEQDEIQLGDVTPLLPMVSGPAVQILPLAICA